ncbi:MAG: hypothetical protein AUJ49_13745 [Desulfovibrionaceae bacterium CG1_02_65_16]|nr:MAG: hypothetical protein AUJ49_13745 [Desulfovibrionaceae bacterium CG1_02_65_16]
MDDRRLDNLEQALLAHARSRQAAALPHDFTARVMREVRQRAERGADFWDVFGLVARRFAPICALMATAVCGYAQFMDRVLGQALLSLSMHGAGVVTLAGLMP